MKQALVQFSFIAQQEQTFGVSVEAADRIDRFGEAELGECSVWGTVGSELGENAVGFVEDEEQRWEVKWLNALDR
jgi:hypothetical protein